MAKYCNPSQSLQVARTAERLRMAADHRLWSELIKLFFVCVCVFIQKNYDRRGITFYNVSELRNPWFVNWISGSAVAFNFSPRWFCYNILGRTCGVQFLNEVSKYSYDTQLFSFKLNVGRPPRSHRSNVCGIWGFHGGGGGDEEEDDDKILQPWKWRKYVFPKRWHRSTSHGSELSSTWVLESYAALNWH